MGPYRCGCLSFRPTARATREAKSWAERPFYHNLTLPVQSWARRLLIDRGRDRASVDAARVRSLTLSFCRTATRLRAYLAVLRVLPERHWMWGGAVSASRRHDASARASGAYNSSDVGLIYTLTTQPRASRAPCECVARRVAPCCGSRGRTWGKFATGACVNPRRHASGEDAQPSLVPRRATKRRGVQAAAASSRPTAFGWARLTRGRPTRHKLRAERPTRFELGETDAQALV